MSPAAGEIASSGIALRDPDTVLRLDRLGSSHQTRLSFLRALLRRIIAERWTFTRPRFDIDARGVGTAVYQVDTGVRIYSLVCFGHDLVPEKRTDRVIAEEWDSTFALFDGIPSDAEIERLRANVPTQEMGRYAATDLVLARANRSVRLFDHVVDSLAAGVQPDAEAVDATGYLMRTTAVYGNGNFGIADRDLFSDRPEMAGPFRAEMLTVFLIRAYTVDLAEHMARVRAPNTATVIAPDVRRRLGVGNATGLGMAPFLVRHPVLLHRWICARETALARVRGVACATAETRARFLSALASAHSLVTRWTTDDAVQAPRIIALQDDLKRLARFVSDGVLDRGHPWDAVYRWAEQHLTLEGQEFTVTLLIEPHGALVDDLADEMAADEASEFPIDGARCCAEVLGEIDHCYPWALGVNFAKADENAIFWYASEEKLEPRIGVRATEPGADLEQPLTVARDVKALRDLLAGEAPDALIGAVLLRHPEHRHTVRRVQTLARYPYAEIRDNLISARMRAIDILRCKLAFFGVTRFDPRSDKWLRITLYQGAPFPGDLASGDWDDWIWPRP